MAETNNAEELDKLNRVVEFFSDQMRNRLRAKWGQGSHGWDSIDARDNHEARLLAKAHKEHKSPKDLIDIANFAMFLYAHSFDKFVAEMGEGKR